jgi:hypothetical protein
LGDWEVDREEEFPDSTIPSIQSHSEFTFFNVLKSLFRTGSSREPSSRHFKCARNEAERFAGRE